MDEKRLEEIEKADLKLQEDLWQNMGNLLYCPETVLAVRAPIPELIAEIRRQRVILAEEIAEIERLRVLMAEEGHDAMCPRVMGVRSFSCACNEDD